MSSRKRVLLARLASGRRARYSSRVSTVAEISEAIEKLDLREQVHLMEILPQCLKISPEDLAWSRLAEPAFAFWDNPDDGAHDLHPVDTMPRSL